MKEELEVYDYDEEEQKEIEAEEDIKESYTFEYSLESYGIDFDVAGIVRRYKEGRIYVPDFQRNFIWSKTRASKFIESLLLGLPVPGIFLFKKEKDQTFEIIDGQQRILSLYSFYENDFSGKKFSLNKVHKDFSGKTYESLSTFDKNKLDDTLLHSTIIRAKKPKDKNYEGIFQIFDRLNTGGIKLRAQEVRASIFQGTFLNLINELANKNNFISLLQCDKKRKKHEEICLRLIALTYNRDEYNGNMKAFLNSFLAENRNLDKINANDLKKLFDANISRICEIGIKEYFRLKNGPINLAILDSVFVGLSYLYRRDLNIDNATIKERIINIIKSESFQDKIKTGKTHHTDSVKERIRIMIEGLKKAENG